MGMYEMQTQITLLAQEIITSKRFYCIIKERLNNILIILWNCNFNSLNVKNLCNSARHKCTVQLPDDDIEMSKHVGIYTKSLKKMDSIEESTALQQTPDSWLRYSKFSAPSAD